MRELEAQAIRDGKAISIYEALERFGTLGAAIDAGWDLMEEHAGLVQREIWTWNPEGLDGPAPETK